MLSYCNKNVMIYYSKAIFLSFFQTSPQLLQIFKIHFKNVLGFLPLAKLEE